MDWTQLAINIAAIWFAGLFGACLFFAVMALINTLLNLGK